MKVATVYHGMGGADGGSGGAGGSGGSGGGDDITMRMTD